MLLKKESISIRGISVLFRQTTFDRELQSNWYNIYKFIIPEKREKKWLRNMVCDTIHPCCDYGAGSFFANYPTITRQGKLIIVKQYCGYDV